MNVADTQRVAAALEHLDYVHVTRAEEADVVVMNTCMVRQSAEDKAVGRLTSLKSLKKKKPDMVINVMGCMVGVKPRKELLQLYPFVDVFSSPSDPRPLITHLYQRMGKDLDEVESSQRFAWLDGDIRLPSYEAGKSVTAFLPIVDGCSNACTYCIIPKLRGNLRSRSVSDIEIEARRMIAAAGESAQASATTRQFGK